MHRRTKPGRAPLASASAPARKPRGDSELKTLPEQDQLQVMAWLRANTQARVIELVREKWGIKTNSASLSEFYSWWHYSRRFEEMAKGADEFRRTLQELKEAGQLDISERGITAAGQAYFEHRAIKDDDPKTFVAMQRLRLKQEQQALDRDRFQRESIKLFLAWFADEQARSIAAGPGTESERTEQLGQRIFGEEWK